MLKFKNKENECLELKDGGTVWKSRSVAVVGLVLERGVCVSEDDPTEMGDYVLLVRRGSGCPDEVGKLCLPCGYLDYDETLYDACRREVWEEAGIDVTELYPYSAWTSSAFLESYHKQPWLIRSDPKINKQNVSAYFVFFCYYTPHEQMPIPTNKNCAPGEVEDAMWVPVEDAIEMDLAFEHQSIIKRYYNQVSGKQEDSNDTVE